jgi:hypothetical protein
MHFYNIISVAGKGFGSKNVVIKSLIDIRHPFPPSSMLNNELTLIYSYNKNNWMQILIERIQMIRSK